MRTGMIGAGHIGSTLAKRLADAGHDVVTSNSRGPETPAGVAAGSGARAVTAIPVSGDDPEAKRVVVGLRTTRRLDLPLILPA